jgi:hypothetical protein
MDLSMATAQIEIDDVGLTTLTYLAKRPSFVTFTPLQSIRSGRMKPDSDAAKAYFAMQDFHAAKLAHQLANDWDAVVMPPSTRPWAEPYLAAVKKLHAAVDLTPRFARAGEVRSGASTTSLDDLAASLSYRQGGDEGRFSKLLFVDDVLAEGKTVRAIVRLLRQNGLPPNATFQIAVPLWLPSAASASSSPG